MLLTVGIAALFFGPLLCQIARVGPRAFGFLEGFSFITLVGLLCFGILPQAIGVGGSAAIAFALVGLVFPIGLEKLFGRLAKQAHLAILALGMLGLLVHAGIDGVALAAGHVADAAPWWRAGHREEGEYLALAVILHRFPVGLAIWTLALPVLGRSAAIMALVALAAATLIGYVFGPEVVATMDGTGIAWFQAFVAGSILHVVIYEPGHGRHAHAHHAHTLEKWPDRIGIVCGLALLYVYF